MRHSTAFEQQVHRIYELLEGSGASVTWNDHISDPDNPRQARQIDITLRRDGILTLIECRDHQTRQDVQWIEELIGRRASLRADAIIAVSSSGFTAGALSKAKSFGIIPRDLRELTELEVKDWGQQTALTLYFYQYSNLELLLCFGNESIPKLDMEGMKCEIASYPGIQSLFNAAAQQLGNLEPLNEENQGQAIEFRLRLQLEGLEFCGEPVLEVDFRGKAAIVSKGVLSPAVFAYRNPEDESVPRAVNLEKFSLGETSIIHEEDKVSIFLDISQLEVPPFCQFRFFRVAGRNEVWHEAVELVGLDKLWVRGGRMNVSICSRTSDSRSTNAT